MGRVEPTLSLREQVDIETIRKTPLDSIKMIEDFFDDYLASCKRKKVSVVYCVNLLKAEKYALVNQFDAALSLLNQTPVIKDSTQKIFYMLECAIFKANIYIQIDDIKNAIPAANTILELIEEHHLSPEQLPFEALVIYDSIIKRLQLLTGNADSSGMAILRKVTRLAEMVFYSTHTEDIPDTDNVNDCIRECPSFPHTYFFLAEIAKKNNAMDRYTKCKKLGIEMLKRMGFKGRILSTHISEITKVELSPDSVDAVSDLAVKNPDPIWISEQYQMFNSFIKSYPEPEAAMTRLKKAIIFRDFLEIVYRKIEDEKIFIDYAEGHFDNIRNSILNLLDIEPSLRLIENIHNPDSRFVYTAYLQYLAHGSDTSIIRRLNDIISGKILVSKNATKIAIITLMKMHLFDKKLEDCLLLGQANVVNYSEDSEFIFLLSFTSILLKIKLLKIKKHNKNTAIVDSEIAQELENIQKVFFKNPFPILNGECIYLYLELLLRTLDENKAREKIVILSEFTAVYKKLTAQMMSTLMLKNEGDFSIMAGVANNSNPKQYKEFHQNPHIKKLLDSDIISQQNRARHAILFRRFDALPAQKAIPTVKKKEENLKQESKSPTSTTKTTPVFPERKKKRKPKPFSALRESTQPMVESEISSHTAQLANKTLENKTLENKTTDDAKKPLTDAQIFLWKQTLLGFTASAKEVEESFRFVPDNSETNIPAYFVFTIPYGHWTVKKSKNDPEIKTIAVVSQNFVKTDTLSRLSRCLKQATIACEEGEFSITVTVTPLENDISNDSDLPKTNTRIYSVLEKLGLIPQASQEDKNTDVPKHDKRDVPKHDKSKEEEKEKRITKNELFTLLNTIAHKKLPKIDFAKFLTESDGKNSNITKIDYLNARRKKDKQKFSEEGKKRTEKSAPKHIRLYFNQYCSANALEKYGIPGGARNVLEILADALGASFQTDENSQITRFTFNTALLGDLTDEKQSGAQKNFDARFEQYKEERLKAETAHLVCVEDNPEAKEHFDSISAQLTDNLRTSTDEALSREIVDFLKGFQYTEADWLKDMVFHRNDVTDLNKLSKQILKYGQAHVNSALSLVQEAIYDLVVFRFCITLNHTFKNQRARDWNIATEMFNRIRDIIKHASHDLSKEDRQRFVTKFEALVISVQENFPVLNSDLMLFDRNRKTTKKSIPLNFDLFAPVLLETVRFSKDQQDKKLGKATSVKAFEKLDEYKKILITLIENDVPEFKDNKRKLAIIAILFRIAPFMKKEAFAEEISIILSHYGHDTLFSELIRTKLWNQYENDIQSLTEEACQLGHNQISCE